MTEVARSVQPLASGEKSIGRIISVSGSQAIVLLEDATGGAGGSGMLRPVMGTLLRVKTPSSMVLGLVSAQSVPVPTPGSRDSEVRILELELVGELSQARRGEALSFQRGVNRHPSLGDQVFATTARDLEMAYSPAHNTIEVGALSQDPNIPARVLVEELLSKHSAVLGTTGTGKSCAVALILRSILDASPNAHILLLDPHSEYATAFGERAEIINFANLDLPYWLFNFDEIAQVVIGDAVDAEDEVDILAELIPIVKAKYASNRRRSTDLSVRKEGFDGAAGITVDTPTPYRLADLLDLIDQRMGSLELKNALRPYKRLKARIETVANDPRYSFMFGKTATQDQMAALLGRLFRVPVNGRPIAIVELTGLPSEIVDVLVSVICRLSYDFAMWGDGRVPLTIVCEEAHRYIPNDPKLGFRPTRKAIARIAKEGRKHSVSLCVVSQRPGELDPTILSQCSTVFALRLSNEADQHIVRAAITDAAASLLEFLPALGEREAIAFGDGVTLPMRFRFLDLPPDALPKGRSARFTDQWKSAEEDERYVDRVVNRWRAAYSALLDLDPWSGAGRPEVPRERAGSMQPPAGARPLAEPGPAPPPAAEPRPAPPPAAESLEARLKLLKERLEQGGSLADPPAGD
jgi:DNA helicase HerA-like ATPase